MFSMIRWCAVIALTFYTSMLYLSVPLALAGYAQCVFLIFAVFFLSYQIHTLEGHIQLPIAIAECKMPLTLRFYVTNRGIFPYTKLKYCLEQGSRFLKKRKKKWLCGRAVQPGIGSYDYTAIFQNYGSYELRLKKIRVYDLTGLFYFDKKINSRGMVQVFPQIQEIGIHLSEAVRSFFGDAEVYDDFRPGYDSSEPFGFRPFQNGDKIQSVHWKLSVKADELLVKEDSMPKACPVVFFLEYRAGARQQENHANAYLVVLASISFSLMDAGCPHYIAWYSDSRKDVVRLRVDDEESLYLFLSCYLQESFPATAPGLQENYEEKYRGERCLHTLWLDESLKLKKDREVIGEFHAKGWEKNLQELEIFL